MKNKSVLLVIAILFIGLSLAGGTYAYLTMAANVTNGNYNTNTTCFNIDYNISNEGSGQDITGTMFPSSGPSGGLSGRVGLKVNASCSTNGLGTLKLHINSSTSSSLMTSASSYCQNRKTLEAISGISTEEACTTAGGRWQGYGDSFCENQVTLQRMTDYTTENACTSAGGTWKSGGSPLKYAVYDNNAATGAPLSKGYITSSDIDTDKVIYTDFIIDSTQAYYYIFIWLDGYLVDNDVNDLPFSGYIKTEANQANVKWVYTAIDDYATGYNAVWLGQTMPNGITEYNTKEAAMAALKTAGGGSTDYPFFLRHKKGDGSLWCATNGTNNYCIYETQTECNSVVYCQESTYTNGISESYLGFVITHAMATANSNMLEGTYYLKGGDNGRAYNENKATLLSAFGSSHCTDKSSYFYCIVSGLYVYAYSNGSVYAYTDPILGCDVNDDGSSFCALG